ncbi:MAG: flagellar biosynthetic protein FliR [Proteobacteria bacterium]|nr:flagellar biosynthetic protein FliR [Pseudomonadota bacterium]
MKYLMVELLDLSQQFLWPFVRVSSLFLTAPIFGASALNLRARVAIGAVVTALIFPQIEVPVIDPFTFSGLSYMFNEVVVGAMMGLVLQIVAAAIILSGQIIAGGMGLGMANMIDPNLGNIPTLSNFFLVLGLLVFLTLGGHLVLISILLDSYEHLPVGASALSLFSINSFISWSSNIFVGAVSLVLPVLVCLLMINVCFGVIARASPSFNIFAVGFPALIPVGLFLIMLTLAFYFTRLESIWYSSFEFLQAMIRK